MEMYLVVAMVIHMFDLKVMDPTPSPVSVCMTYVAWVCYTCCIHVCVQELDMVIFMK